jgi:hypothetical protein
MGYRLKMKNKVVAHNLTITMITNNCLDESHALLIRSGFLRQVLAPYPWMNQPQLIT